MPKPEGSGRKPGSKNKKTVMRTKEVLAELDVNPTTEILKLMEYLEPADQLKAWTTLLGYTEPKPKEEPADDSNDESPDELRDVSNSTLIEFIKLNQKERTDE